MHLDHKIGFEDKIKCFWFIFSCILIGLNIPLLGHFMLAAALIYSYNHDKYHFSLQLLICSWGFGFFEPSKLFFGFVKAPDVFLVIIIMLLIFYKYKNTVEKKVFRSFIMLIFCLVAIMLYNSDQELFSSQLLIARNYLGLFFALVPMTIFAKDKFDIERQFIVALPYCIVVMVFVVLQTLFFSHFILTPSYIVSSSHLSNPSFIDLLNFHLTLKFPWQSEYVRFYPNPCFILIFFITARHFSKLRISFRRYILFVFAIFLTLTRTLWMATIAVFSNKEKVKLSKIVLYLSLVVMLLYVGQNIEERYGLNLRIGDLVEQISGVESFDISTMASLGTGRVAQFIPGYLEMKDKGKFALGLGFIHPEYSQKRNYDPSLFGKEFFIGAVEITQLQSIVDVGLIGLLLIHLLIILPYFYLRTVTKYSVHIKEVLIYFFFLGLGGFGGYNSFYSLSIIGFYYGIVLLSIRSGERLLTRCDS